MSFIDMMRQAEHVINELEEDARNTTPPLTQAEFKELHSEVEACVSAMFMKEFREKSRQND